MTDDTTAASSAATSTRPVLVWHQDTDESRTFASPSEAAQFLNSTPDAVLAAIKSGDAINDYFADWQP